MDKTQVLDLVLTHEPLPLVDYEMECSCGWHPYLVRKHKDIVLSFTDEDKVWRDHFKRVLEGI